jgi:hypothetical protein
LEPLAHQQAKGFANKSIIISNKYKFWWMLLVCFSPIRLIGKQSGAIISSQNLLLKKGKE